MWSWKNKSVPVTPENIFSMMFCGYWTTDYGDHFSGQVNKDAPLAYHGPADIPSGDLVSLMQTRDPHFISAELCKIAVNDPNFSAFNHQNAWSRAQLVELAGNFGFKVQKSDKREILELFSERIPDLREMADWSLYLLFEPI